MKRKWANTLIATAFLITSGAAIQAEQNQPQARQPTADQAKNNATDREIMQKIRRSVLDDKSLSAYAHNVKIISQNGKVTLKGPVRSDEEKRAIEEKAVEVAGAGNVTNGLTVKPAK